MWRKKWYHLLALSLPFLYEISVGYFLRDACGPPKNLTVPIDVEMYLKSTNLYSHNRDSKELGDRYADVILRHNSTFRYVLNVSDSIVQYGKDNIHFYHSNLIAAAELNRTGKLF